MIVRPVPKKHYVVQAEGHKSQPVKRFFGYVGGHLPATKAMVATENRKLIGFFRYTGGSRILSASGTWVRRDYRRRGLAIKMWRRAINKHRPRMIEVTTVSKGMSKLVEVLKLEYPEIKWEWYDWS